MAHQHLMKRRLSRHRALLDEALSRRTRLADHEKAAHDPTTIPTQPRPRTAGTRAALHPHPPIWKAGAPDPTLVAPARSEGARTWA